MKNILFVAFVATLLAAGCQKTEIIGTYTSGSAMTFSTDLKKITKADEATENGEANDPDGSEPATPTYPHPDAPNQMNLQAQGFNIWAYADYDISNATNVDKKTGIFDGMENWYVGYNSPNWSANKAFYWPGKNKQLHFFAVSGSRKKTGEGENLLPADYNVTITPVFKNNEETESSVTEAKMTIQNYEVSTNADDDLMVADFLTQDQDSKGQEESATKGQVVLNFRHTLSKVQFVFNTIESAGSPDVYVQKLTLTNLKNTGTLEVAAKKNSAQTKAGENVPITTVVDPKWGSQGGDQNFSVESKTALNLSDNIDFVTDSKGIEEYKSQNGDLVTTNGTHDPLVTWLMMPQTLTNASQIEVFYLIGNRQFKAVFPLAPIDGDTTNRVATWGENKYTKYIITLAPNLITFSASSTDWEDAHNVAEQN